jgi:PUA-domain protein
MRRGTDHYHMNIATRHHLRSDQVDALHEMLATDLGVELEADTYELVEFADEDFDVVLVDGEPLIWYPDGEPFVTVKGGNVAEPERHVVTVDAGAISFVSDGADVMRPGIVDADEDIEAGDLVVVVEEIHEKTLAIGRALTTGDDMVGEQGKVVESLHHVGDELYEFKA